VSDAGKRALGEGLTDAAGFIVGALAGALLGRLLGFDFMAEAGYSMRAMVGILLVGVCAGLGVWIARRSVRGKTDKNS
jgi:F0F1-type ATP synthase assembly protein I